MKDLSSAWAVGILLLLNVLPSASFAVHSQVGRTLRSTDRAYSCYDSRRKADALRARPTVEEERERFAKAKENRPDATKRVIDFYDRDSKDVKAIERDGPGVASEDQNLFEVMYTMLMLSSMMYTFAALRKIAREGAVLYEPGWGIWPISRFTRKKVPLGIRKTELVLTQGSTSEFGESRYLKRVITVRDLAMFIDANLDVFNKTPEEEINTNPGDLLNTLALLDKAMDIDADLREFDDQFAETQLVYAILVNHDEKRVTVSFRGSVDGLDWPTNLNARLTKLETPAKLKELGFKEEILTHAGFKSYLIDETQAGDEEERKYRRIIANLEDIYEKFPGYSLYITGHSLGAALSSLLAFKIAGSNDLPNVARPITVISFAAPQVGPKVFNSAYQVLERNGLVRNIRVSNQGDFIPGAPPFPPNQPLNRYTQNGLNIYLMRNSQMQVAYRNLKGFFQQGSFRPNANHTIKQHLRRMLQNSDKLKAMTVQSLFADKEIVGDFTT